jgi:tRNA/tmRNA/rRNA uracil-C5-methylase (TrmA/RlmC/RlmD family)
VVFVRHAIPGELVRVEVRDRSHASWWAGDAVEVIEPSEDRVAPPCPMAAVCGGCDFQHIALARQRALKAQVVEELFARVAGLQVGVVTTPAPGDGTGLAYRTRMRYAVADGVVGLRAHGTHEVVRPPLPRCPLADPRLPDQSELEDLVVGGHPSEVQAAVGDNGVSVWADGALASGPPALAHTVAGRAYEVAGNGFWQAHRAAAELLTQAVLEALEPQGGERALDLYCGAGLFAGALAARGARVSGVEQDRTAARSARRNVPEADFKCDKVEHSMRDRAEADLVVLDPPRSGAGKRVVAAIAAARPRAVAYVSCDPATLARDASAFARAGYAVDKLEAFDLFPMTGHIECVARLSRSI